MIHDAHKSPERYYADVESWANDRRRALHASRRTAWAIAGVATLVALCEALALTFLLPLKSVVPYTLMVDRETGYVQALKPIDAQLVAPDAALTRSFLVQYVIAREGFDIDSVQSDYRKVELWSTDQARSEYSTAMQASSPDSPLSRLPRSTVVDVRVKSVNVLASHVALVRFQTIRRDAGGRTGEPSSWASVVRYGFSGKPLAVADRLVNPLGFQVQRYHRSAETLALPDPEPVSARTTIPPVPIATQPSVAGRSAVMDEAPTRPAGAIEMLSGTPTSRHDSGMMRSPE